MGMTCGMEPTVSEEKKRLLEEVDITCGNTYNYNGSREGTSDSLQHVSRCNKHKVEDSVQNFPRHILLQP